MKVSQILQAIQEGQFSDADLRAINQVAVDRLKYRRRAANHMAKATLTEGMTVRVNHPKLEGRTFILTQIKRTKASVRPEGDPFGGYNVPLSLVEQIQ